MGHTEDAGTWPTFTPAKEHRENLARPTLWRPHNLKRKSQVM